MTVNTPEKEVVRAVKEWAQYHPEIMLIRNHTGGIVTESGLRPNENRGAADFILQLSCCAAGIPVLVWFECKSTRGKLSEYQQQFEQEVLKHKGYYFVVRSIQDAEDAIDSVQKHVQKLVPLGMR